MALKTVDLTQQPHRAVFIGSSEEEINYAKRFWQSIQLLPPMESRLVSSDIKQRLRKAPPSRSVSECSAFSKSDKRTVETSTEDRVYADPIQPSKKLDRPSLDSKSMKVTMSYSSQSLFDALNTKSCNLSFDPEWIVAYRLRSLEGSMCGQTSMYPLFTLDYPETISSLNSKSSLLSSITQKRSSQGKFKVSLADIPSTSRKEEVLDRHRKISVTGGKTGVLGGGGREFWSHGQEVKNVATQASRGSIVGITDSQNTEDRRFGFSNWGDQKAGLQEEVFAERQPCFVDEPIEDTESCCSTGNKELSTSTKTTYQSSNPKGGSSDIMKHKLYKPAPSQREIKRKVVKLGKPVYKNLMDIDKAFASLGSQFFNNERAYMSGGPIIFHSLFYPKQKTVVARAPAVSYQVREDERIAPSAPQKREVCVPEPTPRNKKLLMPKEGKERGRNFSLDVQIGSTDQWSDRMGAADISYDFDMVKDWPGSPYISELVEARDTIGIYRLADEPLIQKFPSTEFVSLFQPGQRQTNVGEIPAEKGSRPNRYTVEEINSYNEEKVMPVEQLYEKKPLPECTKCIKASSDHIPGESTFLY